MTKPHKSLLQTLLETIGVHTLAKAKAGNFPTGSAVPSLAMITRHTGICSLLRTYCFPAAVLLTALVKETWLALLPH